MADEVMNALTQILQKLDVITGERSPNKKPEAKPVQDGPASDYEIEPMEEMDSGESESDDEEGMESAEGGEMCAPKGLPMKPEGGVDIMVALGKNKKKL